MMTEMRKYLSLREIQLEEYNMLNKLTRFLEEKNMQYILAGGSMLGAVRHNGFIPWDDDIDILVPRDDYEKLKDYIKSRKLDIEGYAFRLPGDSHYPYPFIKMVNPKLRADETFRDENMKMNLWVDVFPLDHLPNNTVLHRLYICSNYMLKKFLYYGSVSNNYLRQQGHYKNIKQRCKVYIAKCGYFILGGYKGVTVLMDRYAKLVNILCKSSQYMGNGTWPTWLKDYFSLDILFPIVKYRFETGDHCIPENYDGYLKRMYGDYMKIPDVKDRVDHHIEVYCLEGEG